MAEKNIIMQRKTATGYDKYYPKTKAGLVEFADGTTVEAHKADYATFKTNTNNTLTNKADLVNGQVPESQLQNTPKSFDEDMALTYMFLNLW